MRPYIYKTAKEFNLTGFVKNQGASVIINISGRKRDIDSFVLELTHNPPSGAKIDSLQKSPIQTQSFGDFRIVGSAKDIHQNGMILPDLAVCDDCLVDIRNSDNKHFKYAFTNCTKCGPRYSIINDLPYDRINTSMKSFHMCTECFSEYKNPENRRFYAQPNCCPACGPQYYLLSSSGDHIECENSILKTIQLLKEGKIIAIKGIGGYHLVCNAQDVTAIAALRNKKNRPHKPFAVMASSIETVKEICFLNSTEEETIANNKRPIVLLNKKSNHILPDSIAPGLSRYGVLLHYTPLHYFLFDETLQYLVMTSGNISEMPICYKDENALNYLYQVADYFLIHNREIMTPIDDSVVKVINRDVLVIRFGRGYSPTALRLTTPSEIISLGGQQKSSVCFVSKGAAHISQYLGDLSNPDALDEYMQVIARVSRLLNARPQYIAHDLHPNYFSGRYTDELGTKAIAIQHHFAHMAGCMAEHGLTCDVIGIVFDGTGMGTDGTVWGGEFLVGNRSKFTREGHLECASIQGGESAIKEPWKCAVSYLFALNEEMHMYFPELERFQLETVRKALLNQVNCFESSSMGRLYDCIAALVLHRTHISYDAQGAIELESIVDDKIDDYYNYSIFESTVEGAFILSYKSILKGVLADLKEEKPTAYISTKFHNSICRATVDCAIKIRGKNNVNQVVLSGGVFENSYLLKNIQKGLKESGFIVYYNRRVPINDGGLSFGQAAAAVSILEEVAYVSGRTC